MPCRDSSNQIGKATACSLRDYYISRFGPPSSAAFQRAQRNFILSCAGYAVTSYLLQVKDRHNGNLMIDQDGHMIHIDFGQHRGAARTGRRMLLHLHLLLCACR